MNQEETKPKIYFKTTYGKIILGDALQMLKDIPSNSVNLVVTSPPFGLVRKKEYGNVDASDYLDWFKPFATEFHRILTENGSLVIDIGGAWNKGMPTRSLYHFKLLIMLCEEFSFHLAQDYYWWNPSKLPTPAEWVNVRRIRVKDAINTVWWLSKSPYPKASNKRVLQPYSESMDDLLKNGYKAKKRPSGHDISEKFSKDNGGSIPPNLIAIPNTESNSVYVRYCNENNIKQHPARFPSELPEYFIRMLTDIGDSVVDPFGGSCVTGEVCEKLQRNWTCCDIIEEYVKGAVGRFSEPNGSIENKEHTTYTVTKPGALWNGLPSDTLPIHGGQLRDKKEELPEPQKEEIKN
ncbi:site-specific DNA-methyltransferase [Prevotella sp. 10(H)]|uniref:DNA-methyltransferase n=1 Tax=Prevotella sp. 10(H) TaxID=1158294 RepID=UPI00068D9CCC|nr:site-specific DNA-methyltransferase [Prevotella sp. 10(H)]